MQAPRRDEHSPAGAATAGHGQDSLAARIAREEAHAGEMRQVAAGVLHHLNEFDVIILDHRSIDFHHLSGVDERGSTVRRLKCHGALQGWA